MDFGRITVNIYDKLIKEAKGGHDSRFMMYEDKKWNQYCIFSPVLKCYGNTV